MDELTKVRIGTDITIRARLIDSGVAYDFSLTPPVAVRLLSLSQNSLVRDLEYAPDPDDGTVLVVTWRASGQCYTGDYRLIVSAELSGRTATFDAPAFTLVRLLEETGTADQPDGGVSDIGVTLEVESIDTALITQILEECRAATEAAKEAAAAVTATDEAMKKSEAERVDAESGRVSAEQARVSAEAARSEAESGHVSAEQARQTAEKERAAAESLRAAAEKERATAEAQRQAAEAKRQEDTAAAIAAAETATENAETATDEMQELYDTVLASESGRVSAEQDREQAESERVAAEALRVQAEAKRQTDTAQAISDAEDATQAANDAAKKIDIVQTTGNSETSVMSQKAVTDAYAGGIVNINARYAADIYARYTLEEAIALIPSYERDLIKGILYVKKDTNRPTLAFYLALNISNFSNPVNWIEIDIRDISALTNLTKLSQAEGYEMSSMTLTEVMAAIPRTQRLPGKMVIFKDADNSNKYSLAVFLDGSIVSGWTNENNWAVFHLNDLKNLVRTSDLTQALRNKVDKISGKGLSTNDYTDEEKRKLASLPTTIPDEVIQEAVDTYIEENEAGLVLKDNTLNFIGLHTYKLGENILTTPTVVGTGWSGDMESGFTHATGNEEALEFDISSVPLNSKILIRFNASGLTTESKEVYVSVGDSPKIKSYNGRTEFVAGVIYAGGTLKFTPASLFDGTISNLRCCIISNEGTEDFYTQIDSVANKANDFVYGFWNVIIGNAAAAKAQDITRSIAIGYNAMQDMVVGNRNIAIGTYTMPFLTTGENNVAIGADTIYPLKGANNCVGIGKATLGGNQNAEDCVAIGHNAMGIYTFDKDRLKCVCIGIRAGYSVTENCTHVGHRAGANVLGKNNTSIGYNAMAVGERSTVDITGEELTCIGYKSEVDNTSEAKSAVNSTAIGANTKITKSNQVILGNAAVEEVVIAGKKIIFYEDGTVKWEAAS